MSRPPLAGLLLCRVQPGLQVFSRSLTGRQLFSEVHDLLLGTLKPRTHNSITAAAAKSLHMPSASGISIERHWPPLL